MTRHLTEPERWADRPRGGRSAEDLLGAALRRAGAATLPSEATLARVASGRAAAPARGGVLRPWRLAAAALVTLLALGGSVGAARGPLRAWAGRHGLLAPVAAPGTPSPASLRRAHASAAARPAPQAIVETPVVEETPVVAAAPTVAAAPARRAAAIAEVVSEPAEAFEARALKDVFRALRAQEARPDEAIAALDDYDQRFPDGLLRGEARLARVEALLALGRRGEALSLLDGWEPLGVALPRAARAARGDLRAGADRCAEAAFDFAAVLASSDADELGGRALYGRASCSLRAGDAERAAASLSRYLEAHADGPHAAEARDVLARIAAVAPAP